MVPTFLKGTNIPIGYKTSGNTYRGNNENSYASFGNCGLVNPFFDYNSQDKTGPTSAKAETIMIRVLLGRCRLVIIPSIILNL